MPLAWNRRSRRNATEGVPYRLEFPDNLRAWRQGTSPYRALIARDVDALLMTGRCISGDFIAHSSCRVTGNAVAMGEAAGIAAAIAAGTKRLPQEVPWPEIERALQTAQKTELPSA